MLIYISFVLILFACKSEVPEDKPAKPVEIPKAQFVERQLCIDCHEGVAQLWKGSHHDLAMDVATNEAVIGDFNNAEFTHQGLTSTFYKKDGKFFIRTDGPDGELNDYEITYVFGVAPLQQYMVEFPDGRIQLPDVAWDDNPKEEGGQRWVHLHPDEKITPEHIFHWTRRFLNWNYMCAECHSTNIQKNYDLDTNSFDTKWTMIDVGCQACHGPGSNHVEWANTVVERDGYEYKFADTGLEVDLKAADFRTQIDACARCHSRRNGLRKDYEYGKPFMDYYVPQVLVDPFYYPDGQILDEVYVYGSFLQSKKYQHGVRCSDCHNPHTARLRTYGNDLCLSCHSSPLPEQYAGLKGKDYSSPVHHFHKEDSPGVLCVECHMPETNYMVVDPRRDHSFRIPRPDLSEKLGIPNACNRCHTDKSAKWAADKINEVHPSTKENREKEVHFAEVFAAGQAGSSQAKSDLLNIVINQQYPPIIRATAINIVSRFIEKDVVDITALSLGDKDPLVRYEAVRGISVLIRMELGEGDQEKKYSLMVPLLKDPVRAVRSEAARVLTEVPAQLFNENDKPDFNKALREYIERQESIEDRPEAHLNLGIMHENLGDYGKAEISYKTALRLVSDFMPARFKLANLYNRLKQNAEAEEQFRAIIKLEPENGEAHYSLGLLFAELNKLDEAVMFMEKAVKYMPDRARVRYNYALTLRHIGRNAEGLDEMVKAFDSNPRDPAIAQAAAIFFIQDRKWEEALPYIQKLVDLVPDAPGPKQMLKQVEQAIEADEGKHLE